MNDILVHACKAFIPLKWIWNMCYAKQMRLQHAVNVQPANERSLKWAIIYLYANVIQHVHLTHVKWNQKHAQLMHV